MNLVSFLRLIKHSCVTHWVRKTSNVIWLANSRCEKVVSVSYYLCIRYESLLAFSRSEERRKFFKIILCAFFRILLISTRLLKLPEQRINLCMLSAFSEISATQISHNDIDKVLVFALGVVDTKCRPAISTSQPR